MSHQCGTNVQNTSKIVGSAATASLCGKMGLVQCLLNRHLGGTVRKAYVSLLILFFVFPGVCDAKEIFSEQHAAYLIQLAHKNFWGKARLPNGEYVQPKDEKDRETLPIPYADAVRVVQASAPAGVALWCGLDWQAYHSAFMKSETSKSWTDKQMAFIALLFGVAQGNLKKSMAESGPCTEKDSQGAARFLSETKHKLMK